MKRLQTQNTPRSSDVINLAPFDKLLLPFLFSAPVTEGPLCEWAVRSGFRSTAISAGILKNAEVFITWYFDT